MVLKPIDGIKGRGVYVNIDKEEEFYLIYHRLIKKYKAVLCEKYIDGDSFRFTTVGDRFVAAYKRQIAQAVGNGVDSVRALIEQNNSRRRENPRYRDILFNPRKNGIIQTLKEQGLSLDSVLPAGKMAILSTVMNRSRGATLIDATDEVTKETRQWIEGAIRSVPGLNLGGWDVIRDWRGDYWVIEVNHNPAFATHYYIWEGTRRNVAIDILNHAFPETAAR